MFFLCAFLFIRKANPCTGHAQWPCCERDKNARFLTMFLFWMISPEHQPGTKNQYKIFREGVIKQDTSSLVDNKSL